MSPAPSGTPPAGAPTPCTSTDVLLLGMSGGLLAGVLETGVRLVRRAVDGLPIDIGAHILWMPAAANLLFGLLLALLLVPVQRAWPHRLTLPRLIGGLGTLAALVALFPLKGLLTPWTLGFLAVGLGVQAGRLLRPAPARLGAGLRTGVAAGCLLLGLTAGGLAARDRWREARALAALPDAGARAPNVLLLILDTVRAPSLSAYGYEIPTTPVFARLAAAGARFARAYSTAPWTLPSHASIMTGRWMPELGVDWVTPLPARDTTLAEALAARGYRTGAMVANISYTGPWTGLDRGFARYEGATVSLMQVVRSTAVGSWLTELPLLERHLPPAMSDYRRKTAREVNAALLAWLDHSGSRPFFAFLNYQDAHEPYLPQAPFDTAFATLPYPPPPAPRHPTAHLSARPRDMRPYDQAIAYIDHEVGRLLDALAERGLLDNTLVIITSDHGEEFGEHGVWGHGHTLYRNALQVPLILQLAGRVPAGVVVEHAVSLRDLPATVLALVAPGTRSPFPGAPLTRHLGPDVPSGSDSLLVATNWAPRRPPWDPTSRGDLQAVYTDSAALIRDVARQAELYVFPADSAEQHDLATDPAWAATVAALHAQLDRRLPPPARAH